MKDNFEKYFFLSVMWVSVSVATIVAVTTTKAPQCLFAFLVPFLVTEYEY